MFTFNVYDRTSGHEFRDVRFAVQPHKGDPVCIKRDGYANEDFFLIEDVVHYDFEGDNPQCVLYVRKIDFSISTGGAEAKKV